MFCNGAGLCAGIYSAIGVTTAVYERCYFNMVSTRPGCISDSNVYDRTVLFAVGDVGTVQAALAQTAKLINNWGNF